MTILAMATADVRDMSCLGSYSGTTISSTQARTGSYSYAFGSNHNIVFGLNHSTVYFRFALYCPSSDIMSIDIYDASASTCTVTFAANTGVIQAKRSSTVLGTSAGGIVLTNTWQVFEGKFVMHDSTGEVVIKCNGVTVLELTGQDTKIGSYTVVSSLRFTKTGTGTAYLDDILITDDAYPGLGGILVLVPTGNGTYTSWTNDYASVDDNPPNDDTDYVSTDAAVTGTKESFTFNDLASGISNITCIGVKTKAKLDGAGSGNLKNIIVSGGSDHDGTTLALSTVYGWNHSYWSTDPADSGAWTKSKVDALEVGVVSA